MVDKKKYKQTKSFYKYVTAIFVLTLTTEKGKKQAFNSPAQEQGTMILTTRQQHIDGSTVFKGRT